MSIPLDKLIDTEANVYEMTCVAIKEAAIMAAKPNTEEELEKKHEKIVSVVLEKVLNNEVEYSRPEE